MHQAREARGEQFRAAPPPTPAAVTPEQARAIAKEAYVYGFPMVDNYRVMYSYFVNKEDPEYKGDWNQIHNTRKGLHARATRRSRRRTRTRRTRPSVPTCAPSRWC